MKRATAVSVKTVLDPAETKVMIDAVLQSVLSVRVTEAAEISPSYALLWQTIQRLFQSGGKRIRPYLSLLIFQAYSKQPIEAMVPAAAAQELLHLAMLVHDDIIDRDFVRYGVKNVAASYLDHYEIPLPNGRDREHFAQSAAMLAGDLLLAEASALLAETELAPSAVISAQRLLTRAVFESVGGELIDTEATFVAKPESPITIATYKTASYSFVTPLLIGATLAEAPQSEKDILRRFGMAVGKGYQLRDDVIGVFGDEAKTGKSRDGDLREGKNTILIDAFTNLANDAQKETLKQAFGNQNATADQFDAARQAFIESGALDDVSARITEFRTEALSLLQELSISPEHKAALHVFVDRCLERES